MLLNVCVLCCMSRANVLIQCDVLLFCLVICLDVLTDSELLDIVIWLVFSVLLSHIIQVCIYVSYIVD